MSTTLNARRAPAAGLASSTSLSKPQRSFPPSSEASTAARRVSIARPTLPGLSTPSMPSTVSAPRGAPGPRSGFSLRKLLLHASLFSASGLTGNGMGGAQLPPTRLGDTGVASHSTPLSTTPDAQPLPGWPATVPMTGDSACALETPAMAAQPLDLGRPFATALASIAGGLGSMADAALSSVAEAFKSAAPMTTAYPVLSEMKEEYRDEHIQPKPVRNRGMAVPGKRIHYMSQQEKAACKLTVKDGLLYDAQGKLFDTHELKPGEYQDDRFEAIFVMDEQGDLYATNHYQQMLSANRHSSFLSGQRVAAAGQFEVVKGRLIAANAQSGHYEPTEEHNNQFLDRMRAQGVDLKGVVFEHDPRQAWLNHRLRMEALISAALEAERA